ncbi:MAG: ComEC/Rec2 family competence protein [Paludibacter sp.]|nr:ComEC/Rec2 family competence protein [Paludibacter sp.]
MEFLQRTPFFRLLLPFIVGIILYQYVELIHGVVYAMLGLSVLLLVVSFLFRTPVLQFKFRWLFGCGIFVFMLSLGYLLSTEREKENVFDSLHQKGIYQVELIAAPVEKAKSFLCKVDVFRFYDTSWKPACGKAILYIQKDKAASTLRFGDRLLMDAEFAPPDRALNPDGFDYAAYLKRQGVGATCYIPSGTWMMADKNTSFSIPRTADNCRKYLLDIYRKFHIQGNEFAALAALTFGYTDDLNPDLRASYTATGVVHILSVSGMHVGIIYVVIVFLLGFMNRSQRQKVFRAVIIMLFLWAYAFLSGLSLPVIRASLMFSFISVADCFERKSQIYNTIFMSMLAMLLVNPASLYDVGFQLSYAAVLSIIFFKPILDKLYRPETRTTRFVWTMFTVSLAAQVGTTPFTLYYFQQFPNYFLLTNFIAIPLSTIIIYLAIGLLFVSFVPYLSVGAGFLLNKAVWLLNVVIATIQDLPYSVSPVSLDIRQSLVLFLAIFCLSGYYFSRKFTPLAVGLSCLLTASLFSLEVNYHTLTTKRMIVYAGQKNTHVSFINRNQNTVFTTDSVELERLAKAYWRNQKLEQPVFVRNNNWFSDGFACYEGSRVLVLTQELLKKTTTGMPLELDYLIIGNHLKPRIEQILECVHPRKIIVDKSISRWYTENIRQCCQKRSIGFYPVAEQGAYILNIKD